MGCTETAWEQLQAAMAEHRLAHAYIVVGHAKREGRAFVQRLLHRLFPGAEERIDHGVHPDLLVIEPQSKSRTILVGQIEGVIQRLQQKPFEGGWKAAVVLDADRMAEAGANKLLKTLEEPPGRSLLLLVTENPQSLLATIRSRCQRIELDRASVPEAPWSKALYDILEQGVPRSPIEATGQAGQLQMLFDAVKKSLTEAVTAAEKDSEEDADKSVIEARVAGQLRAATSDMLAAVQAWYRDLWLITLGLPDDRLLHRDHTGRLRELAAGLDEDLALKRLRALDQVALRMERNMRPQVLFETALS